VQEASVVVLAALVRRRTHASCLNLGDRQACQGPRQRERIGRQVHGRRNFSSRHLRRSSRRTCSPIWARSERSTSHTTATTRNAHQRPRAAFGSTFIVAGSAQKYSALGGRRQFARRSLRRRRAHDTSCRARGAGGYIRRIGGVLAREMPRHRESRRIGRATRTNSACRFGKIRP